MFRHAKKDARSRTNIQAYDQCVRRAYALSFLIFSEVQRRRERKEVFFLISALKFTSLNFATISKITS